MAASWSGAWRAAFTTTRGSDYFVRDARGTRRLALNRFAVGLDLGAARGGGTQAVFNRCRPPRPARCGLYSYGFGSAAVRSLSSLSRPAGSEENASVWEGRFAFERQRPQNGRPARGPTLGLFATSPLRAVTRVSRSCQPTCAGDGWPTSRSPTAPASPSTSAPRPCVWRPCRAGPLACSARASWPGWVPSPSTEDGSSTPLRRLPSTAPRRSCGRRPTRRSPSRAERSRSAKGPAPGKPVERRPSPLLGRANRQRRPRDVRHQARESSEAEARARPPPVIEIGAFR